MLCSVCNTFDIQALITTAARIKVASNAAYWPTIPPSHKYHLGQGAILYNARNGCDLCSLVWRSWAPTEVTINRLTQSIVADPHRGGQFWITPACNRNGELLVSQTPPEKMSTMGYDDGGRGAQAAYAQRLRAQGMAGVSPAIDGHVHIKDVSLQLMSMRRKYFVT